MRLVSSVLLTPWIQGMRCARVALFDGAGSIRCLFQGARYIALCWGRSVPSFGQISDAPGCCACSCPINRGAKAALSPIGVRGGSPSGPGDGRQRPGGVGGAACKPATPGPVLNLRNSAAWP